MIRRDRQHGVVFDTLDQQAQSLLAGAQRLFRHAALRDLDKSQHDAVNMVCLRPVGLDTHKVPALIVACQLALDRREGGEHPRHIGDEGIVGQRVRNVPQGPVHIARDQVDDRLHARCVPLDAQLAVYEDRADHGRRHQVLKVAVGPADLLDLELELLIDGDQLLVDRL